MRILLLALALLSAAAPAWPAPYFHAGFNQLAGGVFFPAAGAASSSQAGFIVPAIEHDAKDGYWLVPGISWNPLNLGYIGSTDDLLHGKIPFGSSIQTGDLVKTGLRWILRALPDWPAEDRYSLLKSILSDAGKGYYADLGFYGAIPTSEFGRPSRIRPEWYYGATLNKRF